MEKAVDSLCKTICTVGPLGYSPIAPGTLGAVACLPFISVLNLFSKIHQISILIVGVVLSVAVVARYIKGKKDKDPNEVVIDEFVGTLTACMFVPANINWQVSALLAFRLFDIVKPWPVSWIDKRLKNAWGVVGDDVIAGTMGGGILFLIQWYLQLTS